MHGNVVCVAERCKRCLLGDIGRETVRAEFAGKAFSVFRCAFEKKSYTLGIFCYWHHR